MARERPKPAALPDSVRRAVERTVQSTIGSAGSTRGRAQDLVDDVVRRAEHGAARAGRGVREGASRQAEAAAGVPDRVRGAIGDLRFATREDLNRLRERIDALGERVDRIEAQAKPKPKPKPKPSRPAKPRARTPKKQG